MENGWIMVSKSPKWHCGSMLDDKASERDTIVLFIHLWLLPPLEGSHFMYGRRVSCKLNCPSWDQYICLNLIWNPKAQCFSHAAWTSSYDIADPRVNFDQYVRSFPSVLLNTRRWGRLSCTSVTRCAVHVTLRSDPVGKSSEKHYDVGFLLRSSAFLWSGSSEGLSKILQ